MPTKALTLTLLSPSGEVLGTWVTKPSNMNWRVTGGTPHIAHYRGGVRECERHGEGWALRLREGDIPPRTMVPA